MNEASVTMSSWIASTNCSAKQTRELMPRWHSAALEPNRSVPLPHRFLSICLHHKLSRDCQSPGKPCLYASPALAWEGWHLSAPSVATAARVMSGVCTCCWLLTLCSMVSGMK